MVDPHLDVHLDILADRRRRQILRYLRQAADGTASVDDLVDHLRRNDRAVDDRPGGRERLVRQLHHDHLPRLADHGIVDYDRDRGIVRYRPVAAIEGLIDALPDEMSVANP